VELSLEAVEKRVGNELHLDDISLDLHPGLNVLLGPTLAGKTSLMRIMAGLDKPSRGRVWVDGEDVTGRSVRKRDVAFVYQQFINYPSLTIFENIASPLRVKGGLRRQELADRVNSAARMMRIDHLLDRLPAELSGGQQQRTAIARALVTEARLLLLDEPLVNLDYKLREELRVELREIFERRDAVVVYATTEPHEALLLGGTTIVLDEGRALQSGPTLDVYHRPQSRRTAEIFSDPPMNLLPATVANGKVRFSLEVEVPLPSHMEGLEPGDYGIGVRPSHLTLTPGDRQVPVPARVELAEISGSETYLHLEHRESGSTLFRIVAQLEGVHRYDLGQGLDLYLDPDRFFAFHPGGQLAASPRRAPGASGCA
jgi:glycerol transport system ATP-binding protein